MFTKPFRPQAQAFALGRLRTAPIVPVTARGAGPTVSDMLLAQARHDVMAPARAILNLAPMHLARAQAVAAWGHLRQPAAADVSPAARRDADITALQQLGISALAWGVRAAQCVVLGAILGVPWAVLHGAAVGAGRAWASLLPPPRS